MGARKLHWCLLYGLLLFGKNSVVATSSSQEPVQRSFLTKRSRRSNASYKKVLQSSTSTKVLYLIWTNRRHMWEVRQEASSKPSLLKFKAQLHFGWGKKKKKKHISPLGNLCTLQSCRFLPFVKSRNNVCFSVLSESNWSGFIILNQLLKYQGPNNKSCRVCIFLDGIYYL